MRIVSILKKTEKKSILTCTHSQKAYYPNEGFRDIMALYEYEKKKKKQKQNQSKWELETKWHKLIEVAQVIISQKHLITLLHSERPKL